MTQARILAKNIGAGLAAELIGGGLNILVIVLVARHLGTSGFGNYSFIISFVGIFQFIADSGIYAILVREISANKEAAERYIGNAKSLFWILSLFSIFLIVTIITIIKPSREILLSTYIMGLSIIPTFQAIGYNSVFRAFEEMEFNALGFVIHKLALLGFTYFSIRQDYGLRGIISSYLFASVLLWTFYSIMIRRRFFRPRFYFDTGKWWYIIKEAFPLGAGTVMRNFTWHIDTLILSALSTPSAVGFFSAPYKIVHAINILPRVVALPLFPLFSKLAKKSIDELSAKVSLSLKYMFLISIPVFTLIMILSKRLIQIVYGAKFIPSVDSLQILSPVILFLFPITLFVYTFTAIGKQRLYTISIGICLGINAILDFILAPKFTYIGVSIGTLISEIALFIVCYFYIQRLLGRIRIMQLLLKPLAAGTVMGFFLYSIRDSTILVLIPLIFIGLLLYLGVIYLLRPFSHSELSTIKDVIKSLIRRP